MVQVVNVCLYQMGWFSCVLGAAWRFPWLGMSIALCLVCCHFWLAADRATQFKLALTATGIGLLIDSVQLWSGSFVFPQGSIVEWLPPPWMAVLWMQFATTMRYSMIWLSKRYALGAILGLLGGPLAFFAGEQLGAIQFLSPRIANYAILGCLWAVSVPLLVYVSDRLGGRDDVRPEYRWPLPQTGRCG